MNPQAPRSMANRLIQVGATIAIVTAGFAIAHYVFGVTLYDRGTGQPAAPGKLLVILSLVGGVGALACIVGLVINTQKRD